MTGLFIKWGPLDTEMDMNRRKMIWRYRENAMWRWEIWVRHLQAKEHQKWLANNQMLGRGNKMFPKRFQREHGPAPWFQISSWDNKFLLFLVLVTVALGNSINVQSKSLRWGMYWLQNPERPTKHWMSFLKLVGRRYINLTLFLK